MAGPANAKSTSGTAPTAASQGRLSRIRAFRKTKGWLTLYIIMLPTIVTMLVFNYYPKVDAIKMSMYRWQPPQIVEFVGLGNFLDAFSDPLFWQSFQLVSILLAAGLLKMWPGILVAVALHRLTSDRWRYIYQLLFVIPMVVPALVWLLVWKSFYDPHFGLFNRMLNATGLMKVLGYLDGTADAPGLMPLVAQWLKPFTDTAIDPVFGNVWGVILLGAFVIAGARRESEGPRQWTACALVILMSLVPYVAMSGLIKGPAIAIVAAVGVVALMVALARTTGPRWIVWPLLLLAGTAVYAQDLLRLPIAVAVALGVGELLRFRLKDSPREDTLKWCGGLLILCGTLFVLFGKIWTLPTGQFLSGTPTWLGHRDLVIPAIIMWGFPWVGTVGVLIYLSGLQQISQDVYDAAEIDGVGPIGRLFFLELPLIMTQVRINLIFMTIFTLTSYEFFLILLGSSGGPGNKGMVPGLYMFKKAFEEGRFGYACALGMVLFVMILLLTIVYNKYVKVEK